MCQCDRSPELCDVKVVYVYPWDGRCVIGRGKGGLEPLGAARVTTWRGPLALGLQYPITRAGIRQQGPAVLGLRVVGMARFDILFRGGETSKGGKPETRGRDSIWPDARPNLGRAFPFCWLSGSDIPPRYERRSYGGYEKITPRRDLLLPLMPCQGRRRRPLLAKRGPSDPAGLNPPCAACKSCISMLSDCESTRRTGMLCHGRRKRSRRRGPGILWGSLAPMHAGFTL